MMAGRRQGGTCAALKEDPTELLHLNVFLMLRTLCFWQTAGAKLRNGRCVQEPGLLKADWGRPKLWWEWLEGPQLALKASAILRGKDFVRNAETHEA